jgi:hypothetical protein
VMTKKKLLFKLKREKADLLSKNKILYRKILINFYFF